MRTRWKRFAKLLFLLVCAWCTMLMTHEVGHVLVGWIGGGVLQSLELRPWRLPHSLFIPDPHPLCTLWGGPILGCMLPICMACLIRRSWAWFIANFCVIANGTYLVAAWTTMDPLLDTPRMVEQGAPKWMIVLAITAMLAYGYPSFRYSVQRVLEANKEVRNRSDNREIFR